MKTFNIHMETPAVLKKDKLNQEAAKLNILKHAFKMKNFQNTPGNSNKASIDKVNHETAELKNFF